MAQACKHHWIRILPIKLYRTAKNGGSEAVARRQMELVRESTVKPVGKPDAGNRHVRFDERGWETGRRSASVLAPILDSTRLPKGKRPQECGRGRHECLRHIPMRQTVLDDVA